MQKIICSLLGLAFSVAVMAQLKTGTINYEKTQNMHRMIQNEQMKSMIPEFRNSKHQLVFNDSESVYKLIPEVESDENGGGGGFFRMGGNDGSLVYKNVSAGKSIEERELGSKTFLITDSIKNQKWKLVNETKEILGYSCRKAVTTIEVRRGGARTITTNNSGGTTVDTSAQRTPTMVKQEVVAWFATDIASPTGPESYIGLPGAILQLDVDNGLTVIKATEVKTTANTKDLKEPKKGKKVTREEFTKIMMEAFGGQGGGGGQRIMRFGN